MFKVYVTANNQCLKCVQSQQEKYENTVNYDILTSVLLIYLRPTIHSYKNQLINSKDKSVGWFQHK